MELEIQRKTGKSASGCPGSLNCNKRIISKRDNLVSQFLAGVKYSGKKWKKLGNE
jgi:hypothetical protein